MHERQPVDEIVAYLCRPRSVRVQMNRGEYGKTERLILEGENIKSEGKRHGTSTGVFG